MIDTLLVLDGVDLTEWSGRGITQTLQPIPAAALLRRTVNGALIDLSVPELRKYQSVVQCRDMTVPALDGVWPGASVTVDCINELSYTTSGGSPARTVVPGSSRVAGAFTFYRPRLTMRVTQFTTDVDEWRAIVGWTLQLEET